MLRLNSSQASTGSPTAEHINAKLTLQTHSQSSADVAASHDPAVHVLLSSFTS